MLWPIFPTPRVIRNRRRRPDARGDTAHATPADDETLIDRARAGDTDAFRELVDRHHVSIFNIVLRTVRDPALAEDVTQDAFLRAWRSAHQFRGGNVRGWLMRIAVNRAYDALRSRKRRPSDSLDALEYEPVPRWTSTVGAAEQPDSYSARTELSKRLEQLLAQLPDDQRTALLLVDMQGFSYDEAAGIMAVAPGTIKSRISRARARLREEIRADTDASELFDRFVRQESETST
jgi:RNA polymerase sigma-70 factor (ECF subfamily)